MDIGVSLFARSVEGKINKIEKGKKINKIKMCT